MRGLQPDEHVYMVNVRLYRDKSAILFLCQLLKECFYPVAYLIRENRAPVFHAPNDVIRQRVYRVAAGFFRKFHTEIIRLTNLYFYNQVDVFQQLAGSNQFSFQQGRFLPGLKSGVSAPVKGGSG